ncbi:MAG: DNA repair exonuclease [Verrucomicrobiia bacterium]
MKFVHTSDWQLGMAAASVGAAGARVREERLAAGARVVQCAVEEKAEALVVAGDLFESNAVERSLVSRAAEILAAFPRPVIIIPGNHDPYVPGSVWTHPLWAKYPHIQLALDPAPIALPEGTFFPCPLKESFSRRDPTAWISAEDCEKPAIGLAHGNVEGLPGEAPEFPIPRNAAARAKLDFLALGHWHSFAPFADDDGVVRMAYSGTHEQTKFGERSAGQALLVEVKERHAPPAIRELVTGRLRWMTRTDTLRQPGDTARLMKELEEIPQPESTLLRLELSGWIFAGDRGLLEQLATFLEERFLYSRVEREGLLPAPEDHGWLEGLAEGPVRRSGELLLAKANDPGQSEFDRRAAERALLLLLQLTRREI